MRSHPIHIRLSPKECDYLEQSAAVSNIGVSDLIKLRTLEQRLPQKIIDVAPETCLDVACTGRQIHRVTQHLQEAHRQAEPFPQSLLESLQTVLPELKTLLEDIQAQIASLEHCPQSPELSQTTQLAEMQLAENIEREGVTV